MESVTLRPLDDELLMNIAAPYADDFLTVDNSTAVELSFCRCPHGGANVSSVLCHLVIRDNISLASLCRDENSARRHPQDDQLWTLVLLMFPLWTVFGNVLVCLSVYRERSLQTVTNYFIVSLAIADIMVAVLVMPLAVYVEVRRGEWGLGDALCDAWVASDVMCCTASILNLTAISVDRYIAVTRPIQYAKHKNSRRTYIMLALTWIISVAISLPIAVGMNYTERRSQTPTLCTFYNAEFLIYSSMTSFYIPCFIIIFLYWQIFRAIRKRAMRRTAAAAPKPAISGSGSRPQRRLPDVYVVDNHTNAAITERPEGFGIYFRFTLGQLRSITERPDVEMEGSVIDDGGTWGQDGASPAHNDPVSPDCVLSLSSGESPVAAASPRSGAPAADTGEWRRAGRKSGARNSTLRIANHERRLPTFRLTRRTTRMPSDETSGQTKCATKSRDKNASRRERKATKTLAIVLGVFMFCWVPFFTINIVNAVCIRYDLFDYSSVCHLDPMLFSFFVWLGYINSFLNPVIYTIFNVEFRRAFSKILRQPCG